MKPAKRLGEKPKTPSKLWPMRHPLRFARLVRAELAGQRVEKNIQRIEANKEQRTRLEEEAKWAHPSKAAEMAQKSLRIAAKNQKLARSAGKASNRETMLRVKALLSGNAVKSASLQELNEARNGLLWGLANVEKGNFGFDKAQNEKMGRFFQEYLKKTQKEISRREKGQHGKK